MKLIKYRDGESLIKVSITINGIELWSYLYMADEPFNNSQKLQKTPVHELGKAKNLDGDSHYWKIHLGNPGDEDKKVEVYLTWFENETQIAKWIPEEADSDGKVLVKANNGKEITDSCYFIKS